MAPRSIREPSVWSEQQINSKLPADTVLVKWCEELLLLDAWDPTGTRLRTPPSLINEAITHFGLSQRVADMRLAVQERVDGIPSRLYLGISALRFIENGRVLDLVDIRDIRATYPPATSDCNDPVSPALPSPAAQSTSSSHSRSYNTAPSRVQAEETAHSLEHHSHHDPQHSPSSPASVQKFVMTDEIDVPLISPVPLNVTNKSSCTLVEKRLKPSSSTYIYVHPQLGALFAHLATPPSEDGGASSHTQSQMNKATDYGHTPPQSPPASPKLASTRHRQSRDNSPMHSPQQSRSNSRANSPSGLRSSLAVADENGDLWLAADGLEKWGREQQEKERRHRRAESIPSHPVSSSGGRGRDYERIPRPKLSTRSHSSSVASRSESYLSLSRLADLKESEHSG